MIIKITITGYTNNTSIDYTFKVYAYYNGESGNNDTTLGVMSPLNCIGT